MKNDTKVDRGQFYTIKNPFMHNPFFKFIDFLKKNDKNSFDSKWLEPFAGSNNIVEFMDDIKIKKADDLNWNCFDIAPEAQDLNTSGVKIYKRDTLKNFPKDFGFCITNPPYLAKNSAKRNGLYFNENSKYDDLYKECLSKILSECKWASCIVPASFISSGLFLHRIHSIVLIEYLAFEDTEVPVCVVNFCPENMKNKIKIYSGDKFIGNYEDIESFLIKNEDDYYKYDMSFNNTNGQIGIHCVDNNKVESIRFVKGDDIVANISSSSRSITKVYVNTNKNIDDIISKCNDVLKNYRSSTKDIFLTPFKGIRSDGKFRRRLDFSTAKSIIIKSIKSI